jgi:hypothetical protein
MSCSLLWPNVALTVMILSLSAATARADKPIALDPANPHYFLFRGKPTVLIGSTEHYGAVLNLDFDQVKYLNTLQKAGLNVTRTFSGVYIEPNGAFNIARNTLAPAKGRSISPWARSQTPGYANGGDKFDLTQFDEAYFTRLKGFVDQAAQRGVVVELDLFCTMYDNSQWHLSPMYGANNVNGAGDVKNNQVYTMSHNGGLLKYQEALVRKIVLELKDRDNVYYEICNEPYFGNVETAWQDHIASIIVDSEKSFPARHLIAQNIANDHGKVNHPDPNVSIFNFHYAAPAAVIQNEGLNRPIGDDETGFKGTGNAPYLDEAWKFMMSGGAEVDHLDYSFAVGLEDGSFKFPSKQPGGGGTDIRGQLATLHRFIDSFEFIKMKRIASVKGAIGLSEPGRQYALYRAADKAELDVLAGDYTAQWLDVRTGQIVRSEALHHAGGDLALDFANAQAIRLVSKDMPAWSSAPSAGK